MTALTSDALLDRMMTLHPKVIDLTLDRVHRLLGLLIKADIGKSGASHDH